MPQPPQSRAASQGRYTFPAVIDRIIDGDTFVATITIAEAFGETWQAKRVWRLNGCNARESRDPTGGGKAATQNLASILTPVTYVGTVVIPHHLRVIIHSIKVDPYTSALYESARYEASVTLPDGRDLTTLLIQTHWAAGWDGVSQPRPLPPWPRPE